MAKATTKTIRKAKAKPVPVKEIGLKSVAPEIETPELTNQQMVFVEEYLKCWNATQAAKNAGYSENTATEQGSRLLTIVKVSEFIKTRIAEKAMSADEVLERLARYARGSLKPFTKLVGDDIFADLTTDAAQENFELLKKIKPKRRKGGSLGSEWEEYEVEIETHDPLKALELLGRNLKLFADKVDLSSSDGTMTPPISVQIIPYVKPDDSDS